MSNNEPVKSYAKAFADLLEKQYTSKLVQNFQTQGLFIHPSVAPCGNTTHCWEDIKEGPVVYRICYDCGAKKDISFNGEAIDGV